MRPAVGPGTGLRPGGILGKPVAPVVVLMTGVTFGPDPVRLVDPNQLVKFNPKIGVANRSVLPPPVDSFPSANPPRNSLPDILGVGRDFYFARLLEREKALDCPGTIHIYLIRGQKVMFDFDLGALYQVPTRALNQAVRRNLARFPDDFMFQLTARELAYWKSQIVTSNPAAKMGLRKSPLVFTEHGVAMLSSVLNSKRAVQMNILL